MPSMADILRYDPRMYQGFDAQSAPPPEVWDPDSGSFGSPPSKHWIQGPRPGEPGSLNERMAAALPNSSPARDTRLLPQASDAIDRLTSWMSPEAQFAANFAIPGKPMTARAAAKLPGVKVPDYIDKINEARKNDWPIVQHSTAATFEPTANNPLGEFNPEFNRSGQGAATYGPGPYGYHAENPDVAKAYRREFTGSDWKLNGEWVGKDHDTLMPLANVSKANPGAFKFPDGDPQIVTKEMVDKAWPDYLMKTWGEPYQIPGSRDHAEARALFDRLIGKEAQYTVRPAVTYESVLRAPREDFIDLDRRLWAQGQHPHEGLRDWLKSQPGAEDITWRDRPHNTAGEVSLSHIADPREREITAETLMRSGGGKIQPRWMHDWERHSPESMVTDAGPNDPIIKHLDQAAVPGVRFADQLSRNDVLTSGEKTPETTHNYAVWSPIVDILRRYGVAGAAAIPTLASMLQQPSPTQQQ